jgi:inorganic pyrophosphatase
MRKRPAHIVFYLHFTLCIFYRHIVMRIQDTVKFELDKASGFLSLDRPHKFSSIIPSLYGFIPRTYSHTKRCPLLCSNYCMSCFFTDSPPAPRAH